MTRKEQKERMERLRQEPEYKELTELLSRQSKDRQDAFYERYARSSRKEGAMKRTVTPGTQAYDIGRRYVELQKMGKGGREATAIINREYTDRERMEATLRGYAGRYKATLRLRAEHDAGYEGTPATLQPDGSTDPSSRPLTANEVKGIARHVFEEMLHNKQRVMQEMEDMPPEPETVKGEGKGRKENRKFVRVSVSMDENIEKLFKAECKKNGLSAGKMMDAILWNRYNRPKLSYE